MTGELSQRGHLFVIDGDLKRLDCDAVLVPTDSSMTITPTWTEFLGVNPGSLQGQTRPAGWGSSQRVVRYDKSPDRPAVWLGAIGKTTDDPGWYAAGAVEFVTSVGGGLRAASDRTVPPRVAVNVVGSGEGGKRDDKGVLFETLVPALHQAAMDTGVDVVLVTWGTKQYAAAQRKRRDVVRDEGAERVWEFGHRTSNLHQVAPRLALHARRHELVLFIGAGVSMGAGQPAWQDLLDKLAGSTDLGPEELKVLKKLDVRDQAAVIARSLGGAAYREKIGEHLHGDRYALGHGLLASLRAREAVTTNYDRLYEAAVSTAGRKIAVLPYEPVSSQGRWLLKLHGTLERPEGIVLTRSDYLGLHERAGALFGILQAMLMTRHMLFVGYSLTDDSFHKVMHEVRRATGTNDGAARSLGTALLLHDDPLMRRLWDDQLHLIAMADSDEDVGVAARRLDLFLDLVGYHAADVSAFLLDPTYRSMLTDEEQDLSSRTEAILEAARGSGSPIGAELARLLDSLTDQK